MDSLESLIQQARDRTHTQAQRHAAFAELVIQFQQIAHRWALGRLNDGMLAQDAVQESFVIAYQKLHTLKEPKAFPGWLRQIIISQCSRLTRNQTVTIEPIQQNEQLMAAGLTPEPSLVQLEMEQRVLAAIYRLPENEREVTDLFYLWGYSQKEIAKMLEIPVTTVKKRLQYARQNLKGILVSMIDSLAPEPTPQPKPVPIPVRIQTDHRRRYPANRPPF